MSDPVSVTVTFDPSPIASVDVNLLPIGPRGLPGADGAPGIDGADGATGPQGPAGPNAVTSSTTSDGTANLSIATLTLNSATGAVVLYAGAGEASLTYPTTNGTLAVVQSASGVIAASDIGNASTPGKALLTAATSDLQLTGLGGGAKGIELFKAATIAAARTALKIQTKIGTSTGLSAVGVVDITGTTDFELEADTVYKLDLYYTWTSSASSFQLNFVTTGTFVRGGTTPACGQSQSSASAFSTSFFASDTSITMRGNAGEGRTNMPAVGWAIFKTGTAGTGKFQLQLLSGTTLNTITSVLAVLTKQSL